jgi:hypothetical protein
MTIQVRQEFAHCDRCGIMLHTSRSRIAARTDGGARVLFCSELCRDEYAELFGLSERGEWAATTDRGR